MPTPGLRLSPPPPQAASFRTDALDEVRAFVAGVDGEHSRVVHGTGPLAYEWHALTGRAVALRWGRAALAQTIRGAVGAAVLHVSIDSTSTYAFGRRQVRVAPGEGVFIAPEWEFTRRTGPGSVVAVGVDRAALAAEIDARRPRAGGGWGPRSEAVSLQGVRGTALEAAIGRVVAASGAAGHVARRRRNLGEAIAIAAVADLLLGGRAPADVTPVAAARLASVEEWIDAHLGEPITIGRLCRVAGVGPRSLQAAFASRRGVSPMRFVAERRLAAARRQLLLAGPGSDVTSIAVDAGF